MRFQCAGDTEADAFVASVVDAMTFLFGVSRQEAVLRVEQHWRLQLLAGPDDVVYHETPEYWAQTIYWPAASFWWLEEDERKRRGLDRLSPRPLPSAP
jgi:hypothetical protein